MTTTPLLSLRNLRTYFHQDEGTVKAVDGVTFDLLPGGTLGIVGESGCGKSVTARSILRIVDRPGRIMAGEIHFRRRAVAGRPEAERTVDLATLDPDGPEIRAIRGAEIALIFQEPMSSFSPVHTIGDQIGEAIVLHQGLDRRQALAKTIEMLQRVGVSTPVERVRQLASQLSGGLRQRAMIAMALSCHPTLLVADEPTTARDVVVMYLGRVVEQAPVDEIFHAPRHPYTRALLRSIPRIRSQVRERLAPIAGAVPHPYDRPPGCPFHPRCESFMPGKCDRQEPSLRPVGDRHAVSCFLYE